MRLDDGGTATVMNLDGQDWSFDENWRMSGKGTWKLLGSGEYRGPRLASDGQTVRLDVKSGKTPSRTNDPAAEGREATPPAESYWIISIAAEKSQAKLYFFTGDPDARSTLEFSKE
ncbi:hypothetical protein [Streptomyces sp. NPDC007346]|uniref:hypothetical protein n=1 Tax=Streptomyces sp. NPDC007346 TaxID=3154682 RepID=UPI003455075A